MLKAEQQLKDLGLVVFESESPERQKIDFSISDEEDNLAWAWGDSPRDVDWECNHPYQAIEFGDGDEQCECTICGAFGDWHYEEDDKGNKVPEPHEWYPRRYVGGLIDQYIKETQGENA